MRTGQPLGRKGTGTRRLAHLPGISILGVGQFRVHRLHTPHTDRKDISMTGEPIGSFLFILKKIFLISEIQDLNFYPLW